MPETLQYIPGISATLAMSSAHGSMRPSAISGFAMWSTTMRRSGTRSANSRCASGAEVAAADRMQGRAALAREGPARHHPGAATARPARRVPGAGRRRTSASTASGRASRRRSRPSRSTHATTPAMESALPARSNRRSASAIVICACTTTVFDTPARSRCGARSSGR